MDRKEQIAEKCVEAGCDDEESKRHYRLFAHEGWDMHPPAEFVAWLHEKLPVLDAERARARMEKELAGKVGGFASKLRAVLEAFIDRAERNPMATVIRYDMNPVTAWNSDLFRQEYFRAVAKGEANAAMEQDELAPF